MGFILWLAAAYLLLTLGAVMAAVKGHKTVAILLAVVLAAGLAALWMLWANSSM